MLAGEITFVEQLDKEVKVVVVGRGRNLQDRRLFLRCEVLQQLVLEAALLVVFAAEGVITLEVTHNSITR